MKQDIYLYTNKDGTQYISSPETDLEAWAMSCLATTIVTLAVVILVINLYF